MNNKIILSIFMFFLILPIALGDIGWRKCETGTSCTIGDFVYNENYTAYTNQICTINITQPDNIGAVTDGAMTNHSNGWHSYQFSCSKIGLYKAEMYCINNTDIGRANLNFECVLDDPLSRKFSEVSVVLLIFLVGCGALYVSHQRQAVMWSVMATVLFVSNILYSASIQIASTGTGGVFVGSTANIMLIGLNLIFTAYALIVSVKLSFELYKEHK